MPPDTEQLIIDWLGRIETKLDGLIKCGSPGRSECEGHRTAIWTAINGLRKLVWVGVGIAIASSVLLPLLISLRK